MSASVLFRPLGEIRVRITGPARDWISHLVQRVAQRDGLSLVLIIGIYLAVTVPLALDRSHLGYHENDLIKFFIPEAIRLLEGQPLESQWHPPLYAMVLAAAYQLVGDWLDAGLVVSLLAGSVAMAASYRLFLNLVGRPAAWGAVLTLLGSTIFVGEVTRASSDALFLALFLGACLLAVEACRLGSRLAWCCCGTVVGLALLTRANAPPLLLLCLAPLLCLRPARSRGSDCLCAVLGVAIPILAMLWYASASGSHVLPSDNHVNLAASYFAPDQDRTSTDAADAVADRFENLTEVILHDPVLIGRTYMVDLYDLLSADILLLVQAPLNFMFLPGIVFLFAAKRSLLGGLLALVVVAETLLINLKPFEARYYLFLVPLIGAAVGEIVWRILSVEWPRPVRYALVSLFTVMFVFTGAVTVAKVSHIHRVNTDEMAEILPVARWMIGSDALVVARKPNLSFYTAAEWLFMPDLASIEDLGAFLQIQRSDRPLYVLYGEMEQRYRQQYADLTLPAQAPSWLDPVAQSRPPGGWVLYRYDNAAAAGRGAP
jgi:4-amino-4-deoxy-L-arabinose transferase-like glycosyltransferase